MVYIYRLQGPLAMNTHALYTEWMNAGCGRREDWARVCARRSALCGGSWRAECAAVLECVRRGHAEDSALLALLAVGDVDPLTPPSVLTSPFVTERLSRKSKKSAEEALW